MDSNWYESFFEGVVVEMWQEAMPPEMTASEVDFLVRHLKPAPGARVLDVPCGYGRHALALARRGFRVTGVDVSSPMLEQAERGAKEAGLSVDWRRAEMRDLEDEAEFDAAYCCGNSFGYLDAAGTRAFLRGVARALRPGARFALDYGMVAECVLPGLREREWTPVGDLLFLEENHYHPAESCIETTYTFIRDGVTHSRTGLHWVYTAGEVRRFLEEAGFRTVELYKSFQDEPFEVGGHCLVAVAEKE